MLLRYEGVQRAMGPWAHGTAQFGGRKSHRGGTHCSPNREKNVHIIKNMVITNIK